MAKKAKVKAKKSLGISFFVFGVVVGAALAWFSSHDEFTPISLIKKKAAEVVASEFPFPTNFQLIQRKAYTVAYEGRTRNALWVYQRLTPQNYEGDADRSDYDFKEDPLIPKSIRSSTADFRSSGFDRGHLCSAASCRFSKQAMEESFYLSNISPQFAQFNRGYWKHVENHLHDLLKKFSPLHVFMGPLYLPQKVHKDKNFVKYEVIGENQVAVPTHYFLIIFHKEDNEFWGERSYIFPNAHIPPETPLSNFETTVQKIERASGIIFSNE